MQNKSTTANICRTIGPLLIVKIEKPENNHDDLSTVNNVSQEINPTTQELTTKCHEVINLISVFNFQDLHRQDSSDLSTVLEVELDIQFLKDGLTILVPPDIDPPPDQNLSFQQLKDTYAEFYAKRDLIFKNFNPIFLYALDRIGKNVFSSNFCDMRMVTSRSEDDFWSTFNLYYMTRSVKEESSRKGSDVKVENCSVTRSGEPCVFSNEVSLSLTFLRIF